MTWIFVYELTAKERDEAVDGITKLMNDKRLVHNVAFTLPLGEIVRAHEAVEQGRTPGNVVVTLS
jgi:NADPH2:quinone reductase